MKTAKDLKIPFQWDERRPILLEKFFYVPAQYPYKKEPIPFFADDKPIVIEYCSGNGQWIGEKAKQNPHQNWIAVEKRFERARKIWLKIYREEIPNLVVACSEALVFTRFYAPEAVEAFVNFPDPWPKLRHAKHRLVRLEFIEELAQVAAQVTCATDDPGYYNEMKGEFAKSDKWALKQDSRNLPDYGASYFKDLWIQRGRNLHYISYGKS